MASSQNADDTAPKLDRRRLLQGLAATGIAATAGCLGGGGSEGDPDEAREDVQVDLDEVQEGGTLEFAISRGTIGNYDQAQSTQADDSTVFNAVYDGMRTTNPQSEYFNWMASEFEVADAQEVTFPDDYTDYMAEYEIASVEEGTATFDLGDNNLVLGQHPDDADAVANGELSAGDSMRVLTRNEAGDAVDDGTYGTLVRATLHEGIMFHNGDELTAADVVGSYDRLVGSTNQGQQFESFLHARAPEGGDGYVVEMYAVEPDATADISVIPFWIFPEEHHDVPAGDLDPRGDGPVPIGTGPYQIEEFEEGRQLLLTKFEDYWLEDIGLSEKEWWDGPEEFPNSPVIDEINIRFQPEGGQRVAALQDQSIDMAYDLPAADLSTFQQSEDFDEYRVSAATSTGFRFMQMPVVENGGELHNQGVRQALQRMIPRQAIVDTVEEGWAQPARTPFPEPAASVATQGDFEDLFEEDWAYPVEAQPDEAESLINDAGVETPIELTLETNADDTARQDKVELIIGEMENSGLFSAELETPADLDPWFLNNLIAENSEQTYAERNATATLGLAAGFDPDGYARGLHHPDSYKGCCNFFHAPGTFDFIETLDNARFGLEAIQDVSVRQERYDQLWPQIAQTVGNTFIDFSLDVVVAGPDVVGYNAYPDRRAFLSYGLYAPYDQFLTYLDR